MKDALALLTLGMLLLATPKPSSPRPAVAQAGSAPVDRNPVVVELFSSEGCSSCPPADALLSKLETDQPIGDAKIIGLEEHVDYWNHDGWVDPYSSAEWTVRQQAYVERFKGKSPYTPEMIVDGQSQFVASSEHDAEEAIREAARRAKTTIVITAETPTKGDTARFEVRLGNVVGTTDQEPADIWMAVTEEGLETAVKAGENAGRNLHHAAIVRSLHKIGAAPTKGSSAFVLNPQVKLKSNWKRENLRIVVFIQERKTLHILGAATGQVAGQELGIRSLSDTLYSSAATSIADLDCVCESAPGSQRDRLLKQATDALDLAQARYKLGLSSIIELSQAPLNTMQTELEPASAKYDYGTHLSVFNIRSDHRASPFGWSPFDRCRNEGMAAAWD
jgi:hypothetical protein